MYPKWQLWPDAEELVVDLIGSLVASDEKFFAISEKFYQKTSTSLFDWVDHIKFGQSLLSIDDLKKVGYVCELVEAERDTVVMRHPNAQLPRIVIDFNMKSSSVHGVADGIFVYIKSDSLKRQYDCQLVEKVGNNSLFVVERHAYRGMVPRGFDNPSSVMIAQKICVERQRVFNDDSEGMQKTLELIKIIIELIGKDLAADIVLREERAYWEKRNKAAQFQKQRQDELELGWANHDHHTFRSSREHFWTLIEIFKTLGFHCREHFHAGDTAGWGAQVMENPISGHVIFADVDLNPNEKDIDFAREVLPSQIKLGTIGLWCGLHGESILQAGMHHLEIQCCITKFEEDFSGLGYQLQKRFSNESYLKQGFSENERWEVDRGRLDKLLSQESITREEFKRFLKQGANGSVMERLQRRGGFKGFLSESVDATIAATDPRKS